MATESTNGHSEEPVLNAEQLMRLVENRLITDRMLLSMFGDRRRNIEQECGYKQTAEITANDYQDIFDREPVAARVVNVFPMECWQLSPQLIEDEDVDNVTQFEEAWADLGRSILTPGSQGYFKDDRVNPLWSYLERADIWSGIGSYGAILIGIDDGKDLNEPADLKANYGRKLNFLRVLSEVECRISSFDNNRESIRYGKPETYNVVFGTPSFNQTKPYLGSSVGVSQQNVRSVHWSRVVHVVDNPCGTEVGGIPRMQQVYNRLYDLHKLYGGSAEMYWQGAFPGISFETHPSLGGDVKLDEPTRRAMKEQLVNYTQGLQRWLTMAGMTAKTLAPQVVDPTSHIESEIQAICILLGVPKRVFMGSERGELSSNQDIRAWYGRCKHRQDTYLTPFLIAQFVDRLINLGVLPIPKQGYSIQWPDLASATDLEKAQIAVQRMQALSSYMMGQLYQLITPKDALTRVIGYDESEANQMIEDTQENMDQMQEAHLEQSTQPPEPPQGGDQQGGDQGIANSWGNWENEDIDWIDNAWAEEDKVWGYPHVDNAKGNFGHKGRPGKRGGSSKQGGDDEGTPISDVVKSILKQDASKIKGKSKAKQSPAEEQPSERPTKQRVDKKAIAKDTVTLDLWGSKTTVFKIKAGEELPPAAIKAAALVHARAIYGDGGTTMLYHTKSGTWFMSERSIEHSVIADELHEAKLGVGDSMKMDDEWVRAVYHDDGSLWIYDVTGELEDLSDHYDPLELKTMLAKANKAQQSAVRSVFKVNGKVPKLMWFDVATGSDSKISNVWSDEARQKALETRRRNREIKDIKAKPIGEGARKIAERMPAPTSIKQPGHVKYGPGQELRALAGASYENARKHVDTLSHTVDKETRELKDDGDIQSRMIDLNAASHNHYMAAESHKIASGLTKDADQVRYHQLKAGYHNKMREQLGAKWEELRAKQLAEPKPEPAAKSEPPKVDMEAMQRGIKADHAVKQARKAVKDANLGAQFKDASRRNYYLSKAISELNTHIATMEHGGDNYQAEAARLKKKVAEYQALVTNTWSDAAREKSIESRRRHKKAEDYQQTLSGEYWLDNGYAMFADGNIGDMNHEGYAIDQAQRQIADIAGVESDGESVDWDEVVTALKEQAIEQFPGIWDDYKDETGEIDLSYVDFITDLDDEQLAKLGIDRKLYKIAQGHGDVRAYAADNWNWIRLAGNSVQMKSESQLKELADGIADAHQDIDLENESFDIETKRAFYRDVPWSVIDGGKPADLQEYKDHGTPGWGLVYNTWSDKARKAAALSRKAHAAGTKASKLPTANSMVRSMRRFTGHENKPITTKVAAQGIKLHTEAVKYHQAAVRALTAIDPETLSKRENEELVDTIQTHEYSTDHHRGEIKHYKKWLRLYGDTNE